MVMIYETLAIIVAMRAQKKITTSTIMMAIVVINYLLNITRGKNDTSIFNTAVLECSSAGVIQRTQYTYSRVELILNDVNAFA